MDFSYFYLPYFECEPFDFGRCRFLPLHHAECQNLLGNIRHDYLSKSLSNEVDLHGFPLDVTLISLGGCILFETDDGWEVAAMAERAIRDTVELLCHLHTCYLGFFSRSTSENFTLRIASTNFSASAHSSISLREGSYFKLNTMYGNGDKVRIPRPGYILDWTFPMMAHPEKDHPRLFIGLSNALREYSDTSWLRRIVRACTIGNRSILNGVDFDPFDRILFLVVAFETLFDMRSPSGTRFADRMAALIGFLDSQSEGHRFVFGLAQRLHALRSQYSHGNHLDASRIHDSQYGELYTIGRFAFALSVQGVVFAENVGDDPSLDFGSLTTLSHNSISSRNRDA